jgi:hypothetical protein
MKKSAVKVKRIRHYGVYLVLYSGPVRSQDLPGRYKTRQAAQKAIDNHDPMLRYIVKAVR